MAKSQTPNSSIPTITVLFSFLILSTCASSSHGIGTTLGSESSKDFQTLLCLRNHLSNHAEVLASWNNTLPYCSWPGVTCGKKHASRVTAIDLESLGLNGQIPPCIGNLTFLRRINLRGNLLNGGIPPEVGHLGRLVHLNLQSNNFTGVIPYSLSNCSSLQIIDLGNNSLQGEIPLGLANCENLTEISLDTNLLHGSIPAGFGVLPKLSVLFLPSNNLTGNIPYSLGGSSSLAYVNLSHNSLSGGIPPLLANCSSLEALDFEHNNIGGEIPPSLFNSSSLVIINFRQNNLFGSVPHFSHTSPLMSLDLTLNNLAGEIPSSVGNSSSFFELLLAGNRLRGNIPWTLSKLPQLQTLDLSLNNLSGSVPRSLYNISTLAYFGMGRNRLVGEIPEDIGRTLPNIQAFIAGENKFQGRIPDSMINATSLEVIDLSDNAFHGIIPYFENLLNLTTLDLSKNQLEAGDWTFLPSLASCTKLVRLQLDTNKLHGNLPNSIGSLPKSLEVLLLTANKISGPIPHEIGNLKNLTLLYMDQNLLSGGIPNSLGNLPHLFVLSLSQNKLSGKIPPSVGNLSQLSELYLQQNYLSGPIPVALAQCNKLHTLNLSCNSFDGRIPKQLFTLSTLSEGLDLSYNKLSGPIPMEIGGLINLSPLNISNNQLTGEIPSTLGQCLHLESLHLEGNLLDGQIPQSFTELRGISDMDLSRNNLFGQIPDFFEAFHSMSLLNLSFNNLEGPVPTGGIFQNASKVFVQGNKELCAVSSPLKLPRCHTAASKHNHTSNILKIVGFSALSLVVLSIIIGLLFLKKRNKLKQATLPSVKGFKKVTYADIVKATNGFSIANLVGSGKYGSVYKGRTESEEHVVAIKVFKLEQLGATKSFLAECEALRNTRHRNLVRVITVCSTIDRAGNEFKALVLEYLVNGNLESWLHPSPHEHHPKRPLSLSSRIVIVVDIAAALDYLHNHCMPPMAHCDLKPSNVLLDDAMGASVGDFGLTKFLHTSSETRNSTSLVGPRGSVGYIAPEYGFGSRISTEADVYSYGIIILEMLTGKRPTDDMFSDGLSLYKFVEKSFPQNIDDILDPRIVPGLEDEEAGSALNQENHPTAEIMSCIIELVKLGLLCALETPKDRPAMQDIYSNVIAIKEVFSALQG